MKSERTLTLNETLNEDNEHFEFEKNLQTLEKHLSGTGCYISREICLFPGQREILGNTGKYGKYWEIWEILGNTKFQIMNF